MTSTSCLLRSSPVAPAAARARATASGPAPAGERPQVEAHLRLVLSEARRMARRLPRHITADDLLGSGCMGLMTAARRFDPTRGMDFQTFARLKIRAAMLDELRDLDLLSRRARASLNRLNQAKQRFLAQHGREPDRLELAAAAGIAAETLDELSALAERAQAPEPLEAADSAASACSTMQPVERRESVERLTDAVRTLSPRHQAVLAAYYQGDMTFKEIGQRWGVTESRICQLHSEAVRALRTAL